MAQRQNNGPHVLPLVFRGNSETWFYFILQESRVKTFIFHCIFFIFVSYLIRNTFSVAFTTKENNRKIKWQLKFQLGGTSFESFIFNLILWLKQQINQFRRLSKKRWLNKINFCLLYLFPRQRCIRDRKSFLAKCSTFVNTKNPILIKNNKIPFFSLKIIHGFKKKMIDCLTFENFK